ncbi:MAG: hypothetical protein ACPGYV_07185 [Phycisphaeraceae bacterium]
MAYTKCAPNAVSSTEGDRIGFKGRSSVCFSSNDSVYLVSSEYGRDIDGKTPVVTLYIDLPWTIDGDQINANDLNAKVKENVLNEITMGLNVLGYKVQTSI